MIKVVLIDIDNTLLSFSGYVKETMKEGFAHFSLKPYTEDMFATFERINNSLWRQIEQGTMSLEELIGCRWNRIFQELGISFDGRVFESYFRERLFDSAIPEEGAMELLQYLQGKYTLCVASNGPYDQQKHRLKIAGMDSYFAHYFVSSKVGSPKPSKEFFDYCFNALREVGFPNLIPEEVMIIGDSITSDISGGREYGLKTCLYRNGQASISEKPEADYVADRLEEIKAIL